MSSNFLVIANTGFDYGDPNISMYSFWDISEDTMKFHHSAVALTTDESSVLRLRGSEDLLVIDNLLVIMASPAKENTFPFDLNCLDQNMLIFYNIKEKKIIGKQKCKKGYQRYVTGIVKESGGQRLISYNNTLLAICPEVKQPPSNIDDLRSWNINHGRQIFRFFNLDTIEQEMVPFAEYTLEYSNVNEIYSYMARDQKGPNIIHVIFKE